MKLFHPPLYLSVIFFLISLSGYIVLVHHFSLLWSKPDLQTYFIAGQDVLSGRNVYLTGYTYFNFLYTPFASLLFVPFAFGSIEILKWVMTVLSLFSLLLTCWITLLFLGYKSKPVLLSTTLFLSTFLLWLEPVQQTLEYGQINLVLMALVLLGLSLKKRTNVSGILIGIAAAIKLTPAIFILYLLLTKQTRVAVIAFVTIICTIILGFLFIPQSSLLYWSGLFLDTSRIGDPTLIGDQSLNATLSRMFGMTPTTKLVWEIMALIIGASGLWLGKLVYTKKHTLLSILIVAVTGLLISPFSWSHHWVWIVPLIIYFFHSTYTKHYYYGWLGLLALYVIFGWLTPLIPHLSSMHHILNFTIPEFSSVPFLQENTYVILGLLFLIISAIWFFRKSSTRV